MDELENLVKVLDNFIIKKQTDKRIIKTVIPKHNGFTVELVYNLSEPFKLIKTKDGNKTSYQFITADANIIIYQDGDNIEIEYEKGDLEDLGSHILFIKLAHPEFLKDSRND